MRLHRFIVLFMVLGCAVGCGKPDGGVSDAAATCDPARAVQCVDGPVRAQACTGDPIQVDTVLPMPPAQVMCMVYIGSSDDNDNYRLLMVLGRG